MPAGRPFTWDLSAWVVLRDALNHLGPSACEVRRRDGQLVFTEKAAGGQRERLSMTRLLSCGMAVSTACAVIRVLGHEPAVDFGQDADHSSEVVSLRAVGTSPCTGREWVRYEAIRKLAEPVPGRRLLPVHPVILGRLAAGNFWSGTTVSLVRPAWRPALAALGVTVSGQSPLLVLTAEDKWQDHVLAGAALHTTRLNATAAGLLTTVIKLPLMAPRVRAELVEASGIPGFPQAALLVGLGTQDRRTSADGVRGAPGGP